jgi:hypothetical protein
MKAARLGENHYVCHSRIIAEVQSRDNEGIIRIQH